MNYKQASSCFMPGLSSVWIAMIGLSLLLLAVASGCQNAGSTGTPESSGTVSGLESSSQTGQTKNGLGSFTKENFLLIRKGMSLKDVERHIGAPTTRKAATEVLANLTGQLEKAILEEVAWRNDSHYFPARFLNDELAETPIPWDTKLTLANYVQLRYGMTLSECEDLLGPSSKSTTPDSKQNFGEEEVTLHYANFVLDDYGSVSAVFHKDRLSDFSISIRHILSELTEENDPSTKPAK